MPNAKDTPEQRRFARLRRLNLFLFGGVVETPESVYDRQYHGKVPNRETGRAQDTWHQGPPRESPVVERIHFDYDKKTIVVRPVESDGPGPRPQVAPPEE